jgi:hypothetical protein
MTHAVETTTLADILERVLDRGIVIAGDIRIKLVDVELLTIQLRLVICSVERAKEMGMDWWERSEFLSSKARNGQEPQIEELKARIQELESRIAISPTADGEKLTVKAE